MGGCWNGWHAATNSKSRGSPDPPKAHLRSFLLDTGSTDESSQRIWGATIGKSSPILPPAHFLKKKNYFSKKGRRARESHSSYPRWRSTILAVGYFLRAFGASWNWARKSHLCWIEGSSQLQFWLEWAIVFRGQEVGDGDGDIFKRPRKNSWTPKRFSRCCPSFRNFLQWLRGKCYG